MQFTVHLCFPLFLYVYKFAFIFETFCYNRFFQNHYAHPPIIVLRRDSCRISNCLKFKNKPQRCIKASPNLVLYCTERKLWPQKVCCWGWSGLFSLIEELLSIYVRFGGVMAFTLMRRFAKVKFSIDSKKWIRYPSLMYKIVCLVMCAFDMCFLIIRALLLWYSKGILFYFLLSLEH